MRRSFGIYAHELLKRRASRSADPVRFLQILFRIAEYAWMEGVSENVIKSGMDDSPVSVLSRVTNLRDMAPE